MLESIEIARFALPTPDDSGVDVIASLFRCTMFRGTVCWLRPAATAARSSSTMSSLMPSIASAVGAVGCDCCRASWWVPACLCAPLGRKTCAIALLIEVSYPLYLPLRRMADRLTAVHRGRLVGVVGRANAGMIQGGLHGEAWFGRSLNRWYCRLCNANYAMRIINTTAGS